MIATKHPSHPPRKPRQPRSVKETLLELAYRLHASVKISEFRDPALKTVTSARHV